MHAPLLLCINQHMTVEMPGVIDCKDDCGSKFFF